MSFQVWEDWAARTLGRRSLVEPPEFVLHRAIAIGTRRRRRIPPAWLAVAAMVTVGAIGAFLFTRTDRPTLPPREVESTVRSGEIEVGVPMGRLAAMPARFSWEADTRAVRYTVTLYAVDDAVLFEESTTASELALPPELAATLHPAVTYAWAVEAFDENGAVVARSQRTRFEVRP